MKTIEGNADDLLNRWPLLLDTDSIKSLGIAWLFKDDGKWRFLPRVTEDRSLFYNSVFFLRLAWPFGIFASFRWSASTTDKALTQWCLGWKLNGRFAIGVLWLIFLPCWYYFGWHWWYLLGLFAIRAQSDASSATGSTGPNYGQATEFDYGTH